MKVPLTFLQQLTRCRFQKFSRKEIFSIINWFKLFVAHFNSIPNFIHEIDINCKNARTWFSEHYHSELKDVYYNKRYFNGSKRREIGDIFYFLYEDLMVDFDATQS